MFRLKNRNERVVIVTGGDLSDWEKGNILPNDKVIAVDYGLEWCFKNNIRPHFAIGDFDSVSSDFVTQIEQLEIELVILKPEKDETDTEAALLWVIKQKPDSIIILGGFGSRMDHSLANIHLLRLALQANVHCQLQNEHNSIQIIKSNTMIKREHYHYLSLLPLTEVVKGITLSGFKYPLNKATLNIGMTIGISNEWLSEEGHIELDSGELLIIRSKD